MQTKEEHEHKLGVAQTDYVSVCHLSAGYRGRCRLFKENTQRTSTCGLYTQFLPCLTTTYLERAKQNTGWVFGVWGVAQAKGAPTTLGAAVATSQPSPLG